MNILKWREQIHDDLEEKLNFKHEGLAHYSKSYGLDSLSAKVELLKLKDQSGFKKWVAWHFSNPLGNNEGHALVTHGLFDHSAYMRPLISSLLSCGVNVLALELPGHGLDFKQALYCESFDEYTAQNKAAVEWVRDQKSSVLVEVSHSTGGVGRLNQILSSEENCPHKVVFLNPLIKIQMYRLAKVSHRLLSPLLSSMPRKKWGPGEAGDFLEMRERDPLQPWKIPEKWLRHYFEWRESISRYERPGDGENVFVAQGGQDFVVNAKESKKDFNSLVSNSKFSHYPNLGHQMLYGEEGEVQELLTEINRWWCGAGGRCSS